MSNTSGSDNNEYDKIARAVADRLVDDMARDTDVSDQAAVPVSLDNRVGGMFSARQKLSRIKKQISAAVTTVAVVSIVSVCCLRQFSSPKEPDLNDEAGKFVIGTTCEADTADDPATTDIVTEC